MPEKSSSTQLSLVRSATCRLRYIYICVITYPDHIREGRYKKSDQLASVAAERDEMNSLSVRKFLHIAYCFLPLLHTGQEEYVGPLVL